MSTNSSVSIVIPVWNQWQFTKACLETLRPTIGVRDEIIVVDNGSEDATAAQLRHVPGIKVVTNETNLGFAKACNQGAAVATGDVIVFLNNDTLLPSRWLNGLVAPFEDATVAATGPRSNMVSGPQLIESADYENGSMSGLRKFARQWMADHKGQTSETPRLVGFCLAVRRSAFEAIDGFDEGFETGGAEDDDLGLRLIQNGGRLLICHDSFVHHHGHATFDGNGLDWFAIQQENLDRFHTKHGGKPATRRQSSASLVSACMIVKDEEQLLPSCLSALTGLVDEVVIYDTGSSDKSVELARNAGAKVIEGYWDDDFGRARNAALAECSGEWILHVDADEIFDGDPRVLRQQLLDADQSAYQLEILNLSGDGRNDLTHRPCRVFRRNLYQWSGRLHEQVVFRNGDPRTQVGVLRDIRLVHSGYTPSEMDRKNKAERNIRLASLDNESDDGRDAVDKLTNLARSYSFAGNYEEALALYTQARALPSVSDSARRTLLRAGAQACLALERPAEAIEWAEELGEASAIKDGARYLKGMALADLGQWQEALDCFEGLDQMGDDDGVVLPVRNMWVRRAQALFCLERWDEAATTVSKAVDDGDSSEQLWPLAIESYWRSGRELPSLLSNVASKNINEVLGQLVVVPPEAADAALEYLYADVEARSSVLALAIRVAPKLAVERCLEWSARLRDVNLEAQCPLISRSWDTQVSASQRVIAAAVAVAAFGDQRGEASLKEAATGIETSEFESMLVQLSDLHAPLLENFVIACATTPERSYAMGRCLHNLGASDEGIAVVMHGFESGYVNTNLATQAASWLESVGHAEEANLIRNK